MRKFLTVPLAALSLMLGLVTPAAATSPTRAIVLPGAASVEALAAGGGSTFYAGDLFQGNIYRGDIRRGTATLFIRVPHGIQNVGMASDLRHDLLFVAGSLGARGAQGGGQGKAYVYSTRTRALVADYNLGVPNTTFINGVTMTPFGAWFSDSLQPKLYFVPVVAGKPGRLRTLKLSGPAAGKPGTFTLNDIASTPSGRTLLVAPDPLGRLVTINASTGASRVVKSVKIPHADGLVFDGRELWATRTTDNLISRWRLNDNLTKGTWEKDIANPLFRVPLTSVKFGNRLAVANSHLDTGYPPHSKTYEILVIHS